MLARGSAGCPACRDSCLGARGRADAAAVPIGLEASRTLRFGAGTYRARSVNIPSAAPLSASPKRMCRDGWQSASGLAGQRARLAGRVGQRVGGNYYAARADHIHLSAPLARMPCDAPASTAAGSVSKANGSGPMAASDASSASMTWTAEPASAAISASSACRRFGLGNGIRAVTTSYPTARSTQPIADSLRVRLEADAPLVPIADVHPHMVTLEDWEVLLALHTDVRPWDGLIPTDASMLSLPRVLAVLCQTKLTLVVAVAAGHDPIKATGLVFAHISNICERTRPRQGAGLAPRDDFSAG